MYPVGFKSLFVNSSSLLSVNAFFVTKNGRQVSPTLLNPLSTNQPNTIARYTNPRHFMMKIALVLVWVMPFFSNAAV